METLFSFLFMVGAGFIILFGFALVYSIVQGIIEVSKDNNNEIN